MASLEWLFRGDLKDSHYSFEIDLSLCIWPPASSVQSCVTVPRITIKLKIKLIYTILYLTLHLHALAISQFYFFNFFILKEGSFQI